MDKVSELDTILTHTIALNERKNITISGVKKIESLNSEEFVINTNLGILSVKGSNLEMQHLDIEKGILWISGNIDSMIYLNSEKKKEKGNFFGKVFKWFIH